MSSIDRATPERTGARSEPLPPPIRPEMYLVPPSAHVAGTDRRADQHALPGASSATGADGADGADGAPGVDGADGARSADGAAMDVLASTLAAQLWREHDGGEHLCAVLEQLPAGVLIAEAPGGRLLGYNRRAAELWGGPMPAVDSSEQYASQYHGFRPDGSRYSADDFPLARALRQGETVVDEEIEFRVGRGMTRVLLVSAAPVRNAAGEVRTAVATLVDVSQRRAEERRREFAARTAELFTGCSDAETIQRSAVLAIADQLGVSGAAFLEFDAAGVHAAFQMECRNGMVCANAAHALEDLGADVAEGVRRWRVVSIEDVATDERVDALGLQTFASLEARSALLLRVRRDGRPVAALLLMHVAPRHWQKDEIQMVAQLAERAWEAVTAARTGSSLQKNEAWLRMALRGASAVAWEWDLWTDRLLWTEEHSALLGSDPARPLATIADFLAILHDDDRDRTRRAIGRISKLGVADVDFEFRIVRGGQIRWIRVQGRVLGDPRGRPARAFGVLLDVTAQKEAELEREALLARLEEVSQAKSNFIGVMSHEFRTPLTSVIGYADLLATGAVGPLTDRQAQHLGRIKASAWHLTQVVDEVLTFSRMEAGREEFQPARLDCCAVARDAVALVEPAARTRGLRLEFEIPAQLQLFSDEGKLRQILINLLGNAIKFTDEGCVRLRITSVRGNVVFDVEDTGIGIAPEDLERVFERFWQVNQGSTRSHGGTGLGLTVSRRLAELLGGRLTVESRLGEGSRFRAEIPISRGRTRAP